MSEPRREHVDGKTYFIDASGQSWRVHDCIALDDGTLKVAANPTFASARVFVNAARERLIYRFEPGDLHHRDAATLSSQFRRARVWVRPEQ